MCIRPTLGSFGDKHNAGKQSTQVSFLSIIQIMKPNFLFSADLFKIAPSLMFRMETS